jgi:hypothetical protein
VSADDGSRVRVLVSASGPGGTDQAASEPSALIAAAGDAAAAPSSTSAPAAASATQRVANGSGACAGARLRATVDGRSSVTVALGRRVTLRGSLRCAGAPVAGARVELAIAAAAGSTPTRPVQVRTSANGSFSYVLGPGPSRRITASDREFAQDATPTASVSASVLVTPSISLTITPTATTNGHTITFSGRVSGGDEPRGGLPLALEYLEGNRWMIYTLVQASPGDGRFLYRYTFRRTTQSITYTFRMAIPASGIPGYPYQPAASPPRSVHVDP